jgi:uncharacterized protein YhaN
MRLERMNIQGFGAVRDMSISIDAPVTVLYGPNEAGKSTVLHFISAMLYGFPGKGSPAERGEPSGEGVHGGELRFLDKEGIPWVVRRYNRSREGNAASGKGERVHIHKQADNGLVIELGQQELEQYALGGVSRDMFRQLFAVSLSELQEIRSLQSAEMSGYLFHAGIGGGASILEAERKLSQEMDKLYKPRGKVQQTAKLLQSIEDLRTRVADSRAYVSRYNEVVSSILELERRLNLLEQERARDGEDLSLLRKALDIRPAWLEWQEAGVELKELMDSGHFPPDGMPRYEKMLEEERVLLAQSIRVDRAIEDAEDKLGALPVNDFMEHYGDRIEELWAKRSLYEAGSRELAELTAEYKAQGNRLEQLLRDIDPAWTRQELLSLPVSASDREEVRRIGAAFAGYDRRMEALFIEQRGAQRSAAAAESALREARRQLREETERGQEAFAMIKPAAPQETAALWNQLQLEIERWRERRLSGARPVPVSTRRSGRGRLPRMYAGLLTGMAVMTLLLAAVLLWTGAAEAAVVSGIVMLLGMGYIYWSAQRGQQIQDEASEGAPMLDGQGTEHVDHLYSSLVSAPYAAATGSPIPGSRGDRNTALTHDPLMVEARMRELRSVMEGWQAWRQRLDRLTSDCAAAEEKASLQSAELKTIHSTIEQEEKRYLELERQWESWLMSRSLPQSLSPDVMLDVFVKVEQGQELIRQQKSLGLKMDVLLREAEDYIVQCHEIMAADPEADPDGSRNPGVAELGSIHSRWKAYQEDSRQRKALSERIQELRKEAAAMEEEREGLQQRKAVLIASSRSADEETFLRMGAAAKRREELVRTIRHHEITMFSGWDDTGRRRLEQLLELTDAAELEAQCVKKEEAASAAHSLRDELQERRGRLLQERESLESAGNQDSALQQLEEHRSALREIVSQYAVRSMASEFIKRTRRMYEEEKQPQVLQLASRFFSMLTGGVYSRVVMRLGDQSLLAERPTGELVESSRLSRGTAEQLYLAMRLGLIQSMPHAAGLPLLLDDLFVNFDGDRLRYALGAISELSRNRQVVMMTCHRHVAEQTMELIPDARLIPMQP